LDHGDAAEDVGVVGGAPLGGGAVCDFLDGVEGAVVQDQAVYAAEGGERGRDEGVG
jgi:hypothetical protein